MDPNKPRIVALAEARGRAVAAGSARVDLSTELTWRMPPMLKRRRGGLARPLVKAGRAAAARVWRHAPRDRVRRHMRAEGVLDLTGRRCMLDFGSYAEITADGRQWAGRSGRTLASLPPYPERHFGFRPDPLWLFDLLAGATAAEDAGTELVRGAECRRLAVTVDLGQASQATPGGMAVPSAVGRFEELLVLNVAVWIDDDELRRVRFATDMQTHTIELWDFGVSLEALDWSRLPSFRTSGTSA